MMHKDWRQNASIYIPVHPPNLQHGLAFRVCGLLDMDDDVLSMNLIDKHIHSIEKFFDDHHVVEW